MFFDKKNLTIEEVKQKELEFQGIISNFSASNSLWKEMRDYFSVVSAEQREAFKFTYWKWYVELTWKNLNSLSKEDVVTAFIQQVPMALFNNYSVLESLMWYLGFRTLDKQDTQAFYLKIRTAFLQSEEPLGLWQGKNIILKDLVSEYVFMQKRRASSMEEAELISKIRQVLFPKEALIYTYTDPDVGVNRFLELVEFFQEIDGEKIWFVVDLFLNPEQLENQALPLVNQADEIENITIEQLLPEESPIDSELDVVVDSSEEPPTSQEIKSQIESEFKKDAEGNFENIEGVMRRLEEFTEMYNDPKIADMIYYDEEDDKFKWKE